MIVIKQISFGSRQYEEEIALRDKILRKPLGLKFSVEDLARENKDIHLAAYSGETLVGCLVLTPIDDFKIKMRQVAVDESARGQGVGRRLVKVSEENAKELGFKILELSARETAVPFYLKLGYEVFGEPFTEVTLPHRKMRKSL